MRHGRAVSVLVALTLALASARCASSWSGGIRASVHMETDTGVLSVLRVERGGPAARAGLRVGDRVLAVDGVTTSDMTEAELRARVAGEVGSFVSLRVLGEDGAERELRIERGPAPR